MNRARHQMMKIVQKIPIFDGLSLEQAERLIQISRFKQYPVGHTIYDIGEKSEEMLILVKGKLSVLSATGQALSEVLPGQSTGEVGVFTGHDRSAKIVVADDCAGLAVTRVVLTEVMNGDRNMKNVVLENVVNVLSARLAEANSRLDVLSRQAATTPVPEPFVEEPTPAEEDEDESAELVVDGTDDEEDDLLETEELV